MIDKEVLAKGVSGAVLILSSIGIAVEPEWTDDIVAGVFVIVGLLGAIRTWYKSKRHTEKDAEEVKIEKKQKAIDKEVTEISKAIK